MWIKSQWSWTRRRLRLDLAGTHRGSIQIFPACITLHLCGVTFLWEKSESDIVLRAISIGRKVKVIQFCVLFPSGEKWKWNSFVGNFLNSETYLVCQILALVSLRSLVKAQMCSVEFNPSNWNCKSFQLTFTPLLPTSWKRLNRLIIHIIQIDTAPLYLLFIVNVTNILLWYSLMHCIVKDENWERLSKYSIVWYDCTLSL